MILKRIHDVIYKSNNIIIETFKKGRKKEGKEEGRKAGQVTEYKHEDIHVQTSRKS